MDKQSKKNHNKARSKSRDKEHKQKKNGNTHKSKGNDKVKLYVGNLPLDIEESHLSTEFQKAGLVHEVTIVRHNRDGRPLKQSLYGFVIMDSNDANYAVDLYNNHPSFGWTVQKSKDRYVVDHKGARIYRDEEAEKRQKKEDEERRKAVIESMIIKREEKRDKSTDFFETNGQLYAATLLSLANDNVDDSDRQQLAQNLLGLIQLPPQKLSKITQSLEKNLQNGSTILVREVWLGNITSNIDEEKLREEMAYFGEVENTEFYQKENKSFAFVKFRKVSDATRAYEAIDNMKICLDCPNLKVSFSDHQRRKNVVGDSVHAEDPNELTSIVYIGFTPGSIVEPELVVKELFSKYGEVLNISIKQSARDNSAKSYALVEMGSVEQAKIVREKIYIHDTKKEKRTKLGDKNCELCILVKAKPKEISKCIKNPGSIINEYNHKDFFDQNDSPQKWYTPSNNQVRIPEEITEGNGYLISHNRDPRKRMHSTTANDCLQFFEKVAELVNEVSNCKSKESCSKDDDLCDMLPIWSGFITKSKQRRVGVDAHIHFGNDEILKDHYNIDISRRDIYDTIKQDTIDTLVSFVPSNDTQLTEFKLKIEYLQEKERAGVVILKDYYLYILPPGEAANKIKPIGPNEMLGVFISKMHIDHQEPELESTRVNSFKREDSIQSEDDNIITDIISNKQDFDNLLE